jgi:RpiB/LacA/LacB family sugar-phosphate isomerase
MSKTIYLLSDHAGFELKEEIKNYLMSKTGGYLIKDCAIEYDKNDDYPMVVSEFVLESEIFQNEDFGYILAFCGSSNGICIALNRFNNIRSVQGFSVENVKLAREDNDANALCIGSRLTDPQIAKQLVDKFLETDFSGIERHVRRVGQLSDLFRTDWKPKSLD